MKVLFKKYPVVRSILFILLVVFDIISTYILLQSGKTIEVNGIRWGPMEANPLVKIIIGWGWSWFVFIKLAIPLAVVVSISYIWNKSRIAVWVINFALAAYFLVAINNFICLVAIFSF